MRNSKVTRELTFPNHSPYKPTEQGWYSVDEVTRTASNSLVAAADDDLVVRSSTVSSEGLVVAVGEVHGSHAHEYVSQGRSGWVLGLDYQCHGVDY